MIKLVIVDVKNPTIRMLFYLDKSLALSLLVYKITDETVPCIDSIRRMLSSISISLVLSVACNLSEVYAVQLISMTLNPGDFSILFSFINLLACVKSSHFSLMAYLLHKST